MTTTSEQRLRAVTQVRANQALEGFCPDAKDLELHAGFVAGTVTVEDMLAHAREFANQYKNKTGEPAKTKD